MKERRDDREEKLPKWAQDLIGMLRADVRWLDGKLSEMMGGPEDSNTRVVSYSRDSNQNLPNNAAVEFHIGENLGDVIRAGIKDDRFSRFNRPMVEIMGDRCIVLAPSSGNLIHVALEER